MIFFGIVSFGSGIGLTFFNRSSYELFNNRVSFDVPDEFNTISRIKLNDNFRVSYIVDEDYGIFISPFVDLNDIHFSVLDGELGIDVGNSYKSGVLSDLVSSIEVRGPALSSVKVSDGDFYYFGNPGDQVVNFKVSGDRSRVTAYGNYSSLDLDISGNAEFSAYNSIVQNLNIKQTGGSKVSIGTVEKMNIGSTEKCQVSEANAINIDNLLMDVYTYNGKLINDFNYETECGYLNIDVKNGDEQ